MKKTTNIYSLPAFGISALLALVLVGCGKDKKQNPAPASVVAKPAEYSLPPEEKCPVWNGKFVRSSSSKKTKFTAIETKREGDRYFYAFSDSGQFFEANGVPQELKIAGQRGTVTVSCEANIVTFVAQSVGGRRKITRYEYLSPEQFIARSNASKDDSGLYDLIDQEVQTASLQN